ncbi:hypothetical protein [Bacillus sp. LL01]|uniref:hypothetical protein n=1 Tax=Bacillus sp. LL01 TaxID=1665556 RepID=UPI0018E394FD|nr:hypothetical protein [Bacillus sp. LL01]
MGVQAALLAAVLEQVEVVAVQVRYNWIQNRLSISAQPGCSSFVSVKQILSMQIISNILLHLFELLLSLFELMANSNELIAILFESATKMFELTATLIESPTNISN